MSVICNTEFKDPWRRISGGIWPQNGGGNLQFCKYLAVRYLVLTYDHSKRQWIMDRLVEPVLVMDEDDLDSEGCGPHFGAVVPQN